jgi:hypothetical protein
LAAVVSFQAHERPGRLTLEVTPIPLDPGDSARLSVGPLRFRGGLWLRSSDPRFGGLSDLRVRHDGRRLLAVSDCGRGFVATLDYDARGNLAGLHSAELVDLLGPAGQPLSRREIDAEGLTLEDDGLVVAFEGAAPRLWRYTLDPPFTGRAEPFPAPLFGDACRGNSGPELLASLDDQRVVVACEGAGPSTTLWVGRGDHWTRHAYPLGGDGPADSFHPTAAARDPEGGLFVLERRFPPLGIRLVHLAEADLDGERPLEPRELARLQPPLSVDNFEGLDARPDGEATLLYMLSDDNGCDKLSGAPPSRLQRTLLLLFELEKVLGSRP